jgi:ABC-type glycerol-3-phosphate transport system substrate-binding protein
METPPATWNELLAGNHKFLFPGNGGDGFRNSPLLLQYIGAGGQLLEDGSVSSDEALEAVFEFLVEGRIRGVIPGDVTEIASLGAAWTTFVNRGGGVATSAADTFLENRDSAPQVQYAQMPTRNGLPTTIADTWAFVVLTEEPAQRERVLALLKYLMAPNTQGTWGQYARRLPSNQAALTEWSATDDDYREFLKRQLEVAVALPNGRAFADFSRRLQIAQSGVLRGEITADEAVKQVRSSE